MSRPLRILMVLHMPWTRDLGAPRCFVELADEFRALGHRVEKYDLDDALPRRGRLTGYFERWLFAQRAVRHVRRVGGDYDVIMAAQTNLPVSRRRLNFAGVLTTRSDGLAHFYAAYERDAARRARAEGRRGRLLGRLARWAAERVWDEVASAEATFDNADLITLLNADEFEFVRSLPGGYAEKAVVLPNGLTEERRAALAAAAQAAKRRWASPRVGFVGAWGERKGKADLPVIVRHLRAARPDVAVRLMGTAEAAETVRAAFDPADRAAVEVVPRYTPAELPGLLSDVTVGLLPSYIEGFPMAVLEMLAAGVPVVAYDVPGPRAMLRDWPVPLLVPPGATTEAAARLGDIFVEPGRYADLSEVARAVAGRCRWSEVAAALLGKWRLLLDGPRASQNRPLVAGARDASGTQASG